MGIGKLTAVSFAGAQALALTRDDERAATIELASVIAGRKVLAPLGDEAVFASAALSEDGWSF
jgi:hypothetical protein